jgi:hypothetical protein
MSLRAVSHLQAGGMYSLLFEFFSLVFIGGFKSGLIAAKEPGIITMNCTPHSADTPPDQEIDTIAWSKAVQYAIEVSNILHHTVLVHVSIGGCPCRTH